MGLIDRLKRHISICRSWKLAGKDYDENTRVPFFISEVDTKILIDALTKNK